MEYINKLTRYILRFAYRHNKEEIMVSFAYRDKERRQRINANQAVQENMEKRYYCPNPACDADMYIRERKGLKSPYFGASRGHSHVANCCFMNSKNKFKPAEYDEDAFSFDDAISSLLAKKVAGKNKKENTRNHGDGQPQPLPPSTLRQIYFMCKTLPIYDTYAGMHIYDMILDDRSISANDGDFTGNRIIECNGEKGYIYFDDCNEIRLKAPFERKNNKIILKFNDTDLYEYEKSVIYNNREKIIVVAGNWEQKDEKTLQTNVSSKEQIYINKSRSKS